MLDAIRVGVVGVTDPASSASAALEVRRDVADAAVLKPPLRDAIKEREKIRRAGWFS